LATSAAAGQQGAAKKRTYRPKEIILSGIQPTGVPHLGNYLGALQVWKQFQDEKAEPNQKKRRNHSLYYFIADLHALTAKQNREDRVRLRKETFASLLAIGLDPKLSILFYQSDVSLPFQREAVLLIRAGSLSLRAHVDPQHHRLDGIPVQDDAVEGTLV